MKENVKRNWMAIIIPLLLYIVAVVLLFWFHPFVASAKEDDTTTKKAPGGNGNTVHIYEKVLNTYNGQTEVKDRTVKANDDVEILGYLRTFDSGEQYVYFVVCHNGVESFNESLSNLLSDYVGVLMNYDKNGQLTSSRTIDVNFILGNAHYYAPPDSIQVVTCIVTGLKIFKDREALDVYLENGSLDGMIKEELDTSWYLKDIRCEVTADDSPSGSGGEDATYIKFYWLTDNLQDGDLLEIKTRNYYKKIGGDQVYGFHDYITFHDNISCLDGIFSDEEGNERGSYTLGQYDATKAWFATVENKPLIFKSYETEIYYFRPYRNGKYGKWCKVTMNRFGDAGSPYIEDVEVGDLDDDGNWDKDDELTDDNGGNHGVDQGGNITRPDPDNPFEGTNIAAIFQYMFDFFKSIPSLLGDLPALVNSIIGFLPLPVIGFIAAGILVAIVLRIVGR